MSLRAVSVFASLDLTLDELQSRDRYLTGAGWFTVGYHETPDGDPIVGIVYQTEFDAAQEYGIRDLRTAVTSEDPRAFRITETGRQHITVLKDHSGFALSVWQLDHRTVPWADEIRHLGPNYVEEWQRAQNARRYRASDDVQELLDPWKTVKTLRETAKRLGVSPLPRKKTHLLQAMMEHPNIAVDLPDRWAAVFRGGGTLLIRAVGDGLTARVLRKISEAAAAGTLGIGDASGPFSTGTFFYDTRDETPQLVADREEAFDLYEQRMADLAPVEASLRDQGFTFRRIGDPRESEGTVTYVVSTWTPEVFNGRLTLEGLRSLGDRLSGDRI